MANQKLGTARPIWLAAITATSPVRPRRCAAKTPAESATTAVIAMASSASGALTASGRAISAAIEEP